MAELKALSTSVLVHISKQLAVPLKGMVAVIGLLDEGATVPFIARYRKEATEPRGFPHQACGSPRGAGPAAGRIRHSHDP